MDKQVRFETSGALGILTLANPPLNLFSEELIEDLRGAVTAAKQTPLRALMVRAEGKIFSGGADVRIFKGRTSAHARERVTSHLRTIADLEELPCPTLAAVQGLCLAAGLELALACDLIWAGASARFAQAEASMAPRRCSAAFSASPSAPARAVREKSSIPPSSTTRRRSNDGTSSTALFPMMHLKRRLGHSPRNWPRALPWRMPPASGSSERISTEVSAQRTGLSTKSARHSSRAKTCKRA
jgi:hypothetical protein